MKRAFPLLLFAGILYSCGNEEEKCAYIPDVEPASVQFEFQQLHDSIAGIDSKTELVALFTREPMIRDFVFARTRYPDDSTFINTLVKKFTNPHFDSLNMEIHRVFGDLSELKSEFQQAFANLKYYYPDFTPPKVQTVISGLDNDLFVSDSLIIVSLDFYLGPGARYRPQLYEYLLRPYRKENIVPSCMLLYGIDERFNKTALADKSVLADMIAYGKSFYFAKHMLPCVPDSILISYTPEEIQGSRKNQELIWARLIQDRVLYSTSSLVKQKFLGERPKTMEVGEKCPGRIGQWVGWQIVKSYMEANQNHSLPQLMAQPDAQQIFKNSKYKPGRR